MAWPYDDLPPDPMETDYGAIGFPGMGEVEAPSPQFPEAFSGEIAYPEALPGTLMPSPQGFWANVVRGSGAHPFHFEPRRSGQGIDLLLAALAGFGNARAGQAATEMSETEKKNTRLREAASEMAKRMHENRRAALAAQTAANTLKATERYRGEIGSREERRVAEQERHNRAMEAKAPVGASELGPAEAALLWGLVSQGGAFPPLGRGGITSPGGKAILRAGLNAPAAAGQAAPTPAERGTALAGARASQQANTAALRSIETALAQQTAFASTLERNTATLRRTATKVVDLGARFANAPLRAGLGQLGSADVAAYSAALLPVQTESARLLSAGPALGGQLTDTARKELQHIVSGDFNAKQLSAVLDILDQDARNRVQSYTEQRDALRGSVGAPVRKAAATPGVKPGGWFDRNRPGGR